MVHLASHGARRTRDVTSLEEEEEEDSIAKCNSVVSCGTNAKG